MAKGIALTIGLNQIDPGYYGGTHDLGGCENDATQVAEYARGRGFDVRAPLLTSQATRDNVANTLLAIAQNELDAGDMLWIHYSGHGSEIDDKVNSGITDQTWCLYDGMMLDKELLRLWLWFKPGVRIILTSDSCHSGSISRDLMMRHEEANTRAIGRPIRFRLIPPGESRAILKRNEVFMRGILTDISTGPRVATTDVKASVTLISGCRDKELSSDLGDNGAFTRTMLDVLRQGQYGGTYMGLRDAVAAQLTPYDQDPQLSTIGAIDIDFGIREPFTF